MATTIHGTNGANGTNGTHPTKGKNGTDAIFSNNGQIGAGLFNVVAVGGNGGRGGRGTGPANGADGGNGGAARIALNGNIFNNPAITNLTVQGTAVGGTGGAGGTSVNASPGLQGHGGDAQVDINGNIVAPGLNMGTIRLNAVARGGRGSVYGNAAANVNGNIIQPAKASRVYLTAQAKANGADDPSHDGDPAFGVKTANVNGNIVQGNIAYVTLSADAFPSNGTASVSGNIVQISPPTRTGTVTLEASGNHITITQNKFYLGRQQLNLTVNQYGPYDVTIQNNEFYGTGHNTFVFTDNALPGPHTDMVTVNLGTSLFQFNSQNNILSGFANVTLLGDVNFTLTGDNNDNILTGGDGDDIIHGLGGNDTIYGNGGNDQLFGDSGNDTLYGGNGDDILTGGDGDDILDGGPGSDTASYADAPAGVTVNLGIAGPQNTGGAGTDTLTGIENVTGSAFDDVLEGDANDNILKGGAGDDILIATAGNDILDGESDPIGNTADFRNATSGVSVDLNIATPQDLTASGLGQVTLMSIQNLTGSDFGDTLIGDGVANILTGGDGDDSLRGGAGNDTLIGGLGSDTADYSDETANGLVVDLSAGTSSGTYTGNDTLNGIENIIGSGFNDTLTGDANDNVIRGGAGDDVLTGNGGTDTADFSDGTADGLVVNLTAGTALGGGLGSDTLTGFSNVTGSGFNDTLIGDGANNVLDGGAGDDLLQGGAGNDTLIGGLGNDTADYSDETANGLTVDLSAGTSSGVFTGNDTLTGIENVNGSGFNDTLVGDGANNVLNGGAGDDTITGGLGDDTIDGGIGDDTAVFSAVPTSITWNGSGYTVTGPDGTDTLTDIEHIQVGGSNVLIVGTGGYATINAAIAAANAGDTIMIMAGTYNENVVVNKSVSLVGMGNPGDVVIQGTFQSDNGVGNGATDTSTFLSTAPAYSGAAGDGIAVSADNVTLSNLTVQGFLNAVSASGPSVTGLTMNGMDLQHSVFGFIKAAPTTLTGLNINGGTIADAYIGVYFYNNVLGSGDAVNSTISGTDFHDITQKGIYIETAQGNTLFDGLTMTNVGEYGGGPAFGAQGKNGAGIDSNLKFHVFTGTLTISNFTFNDVGSSTGNGLYPDGHFNGGAIVLNGRDDAPSYSANPADVSGLTVLVADGSIDGTSTGIRAGEAGKPSPANNVTGPAVTIQNVDILNNMVNALHDQIDNHTHSVMTVLGGSGDDTYHSADTSVSTGPIYFFGSGGNDSLWGAGGDDQFDGGAGNDILFGRGGNDTIDGGTDTDVAYYRGREAEYTSVSLTAVTGGPDGDDTLTNVERLKFLSPTHVSDLDNNGYGDLVFQNIVNGNLHVRTQGPGAVNKSTTNPLAWKAVGTGQFSADTDRNASLLLQNTTTGDLEIRTGLNTVTPVTSLFTTQPGSTDWKAISAGDFNGDAASDVLLQNQITGDAEIFIMGGTPGTVDHVSAAITAPGANYKVIGSGDFNGDGDSDILWQDSATKDVQVSLMKGESATNTPSPLSPGVDYTAIGSGDFNGDGLSDILFTNGNDNSAQIWTMNGDAQSGLPINVAQPAANFVALGAQDINNDGFSDILWQDPTTGAVKATEFTTGGAVLTTVNLSAPNSSWHLVASGGGG